MLADWKSRDLTQEDCADLAAYGNIPSTDNLPLVSGNQVVYFFISPYGSIQANRQYTKDRNTAFVTLTVEDINQYLMMRLTLMLIFFESM